jgi:hypothetical protein
MLNYSREKRDNIGSAIIVALLFTSLIIILIGYQKLNSGPYEDDYKETTCIIGPCTNVNMTIGGYFKCITIIQMSKVITDITDCKNKNITCYYQCIDIANSLTIIQPKKINKQAWIVGLCISSVMALLCICGATLLLLYPTRSNYENSY